VAFQPRIVAHRGLAGYAPENTRAAYVAALALGFGIEVDLSLTADGEIVMLHDRTVDRTTDGSGRVADIPLASIRQLDAGAWFGPAYTGQRVPTLSEALELARAESAHSYVALDIKGVPDETLPRVVRSVEQHRMLDRVLAIGQTISSPTLRAALKSLNAAMPTSRLVPAPSDWDDAIADKDVDWLYIRFVPSSDAVRRAHTAGKRVFKAGPLALGIEPENWRELARVGVDAILSDYPLECRASLRGTDSGG